MQFLSRMKRDATGNLLLSGAVQLMHNSPQEIFYSAYEGAWDMVYVRVHWFLQLQAKNATIVNVHLLRVIAIEKIFL